MGRIATVPLPPTAVHANAASAIFFPATAWRGAGPVNVVRVKFEVAALGTDLEIGVAYQTANEEDSPDTAVLIGSVAQATGTSFYPSGKVSIEANLDDKQLVRFGFIAQRAAGTGLTLGFALGQVELFDDK